MKRVDGYDNDEDEGEEVTIGPLLRGPLYTKDPGEGKRRKLIRGMLAILVILLAVAFVVVGRKEEKAASGDVIAKETVQKVPPKLCPRFCQARLEQRKQHHGGDFLKASDLMQQFQTAKKNLDDDLKVKYGKYYDDMMLENGKWRKGFSGANENNISSERFRRKLMMKLLEMQVAIHADNEHLEGCNCTRYGSSSQNRRLETQTLVLPEIQQTFSNFVWATGGHSAAAGHGNLFNESYTAFMERSAKPVFEAVGIGFEGRNYAMGGMRSAPEFALCQESIFGLDADVVSWDFGMCDAGPNEYKQDLYMARVGRQRNRPAFVGINFEDFRVDMMRKLEDIGLTTFHLNERTDVDAMRSAIPDMLGMNQQEIDQVPEYVRYFKCKDQIETGQPGCDEHKYSDGMCVDRLHKASWHPGWRWQSLTGQMMAFFLVEHLEAAIEELENAGEYDPSVMLTTLKELEDEDHARFISEDKIPKEPIVNFLDEDFVSHVDPNIIRNGTLICHTALLPSKIRYKGILTETDEAGGMNYYKGEEYAVASNDKSSDGKMRLVFEQGERGPFCPVLTKIDDKDEFYTNEFDDWTSITIPNDAEIAEYGPFQPKGIIMLCLKMCDWGNCVSEELREDALKDGRMKMKVNGVPVTGVSQAHECFFIKHDDGYVFKDEDGRFTFEVYAERSTEGHKHFVRISSFIIF
ncbi:hypothetical protein MHU86_14116 [Fragilaria crotonensis]|nr:hypothetical protein MHU86_14116 [Fragilaria crotonensis]